MRGQRAQSTVEFALVGPVVLLLLMVILDFGRGFFYYSEMAAASREAARQAVLASNSASNSGPPACSPACQSAGVLPQIQAVASFGYPVVYADSSALGSAPSYGTYTAGSGPSVPGTIALAGGTQSNKVYVFVYQLGGGTSPNPRWACPSCDPAVRTGNHQLVVVDLKMRFQPDTLAFLGISSPVVFDSQTVERLEY